MNGFPRWMKLFLVLVLVMFLACGYWFYRYQERQVRQDVEHDLMAVARFKVEQLTAWRAERLADAAVLAESPFLAPAIARWMHTPAPEGSRAIREHLESLKRNYHYTDILLADPAGNILLGLEKGNQAHRGLQQVLPQVRETGRPAYTFLHREEGDANPHISMASPVFEGQGRVQSFLGAIILINDARDFLYPLLLSWPTPSKTAETLLVRRDGDSVLFLNDLRHMPDTALKLRFPLTREDLPAVMAVKGLQGVVEGRDYRGEKVLAAILPVPDSNWFMVSKMDAREALAPWRLRAALIMVVTLGLAALAGVGLMVVWQRNQKAAYRSLYRAEAARSESEARYQVTLQSMGDALITTDVQGRVALMNSVAERLTGWSREEARGKKVEEVFRIFNEESRQPVESPVEKVFREGQVVGLANHTSLLARDGTERPIADSGAPIRDEEGRIQGVVLVFHDQTKERAARRTIAQALEREAHLKQVLLAIRNVNQLIVEETEPRSLIQRACESLTSSLGYFNAWITLAGEDGKCAVQTAVSGLDGDFEVLKEMMIRGEHPSCMTHAIHRQGVVIIENPEENCPDCPFSGQYVGRAALACALAFEGRVFGTITVSVPRALASDREGQELFAELARDLAFALRRMESEKALAEARSRFREIFEGSRDGYVMVDPSGRITDANQAFCSMLGYSLDELQVMEDFYRITPQRWRKWEEEKIWNNRLLGQGYSGVYEKEYVRKDGTVFPVELQSYAVRGGDGRLEYLWGVARDITERKMAEESLKTAHARLEALWNITSLANADFKTICDHVLETLVKMTASQYGFYGFMNADESVMTIHSWSGEAMEGCGIMHKPQRFPISDSGVWAQAVRQRSPLVLNDYAGGHPAKKGCPEGHVSLSNLLVVPFFVDGKIVALAAVANRADAYGQDDVSQIQAFLTSVQAVTDRMRAEEALRTSEENLHSLFNAIHESVCLFERSGKIIAVNETFAQRLEKTPADCAGKSIYDLVPPYIAQRRRTIIEQESEKGKPFVFEDERDGIWLQHSIFPIRSENGKVDRFAVFATDITERRRAEGALRESREFMRGTLDSLSANVCVLDENGVILAVNNAWRQFAADNPPAGDNIAEGANYLEVCDAAKGEDRNAAQAFAAGIREVLAGHRDLFEWEYPCHSPEEKRWFIGRVTRFTGAGGGRAVVAHENITQRKRAEEALKRSEGRVRAKLNAILQPEEDDSVLDLGDIIDVEAIQAVMDDFHRMTNIGVAIVDMTGKVLVATGWQDICTRFHRAHPETARNCMESDTILSQGVQPGTFKMYKCKNNMWDIATPIVIGGRHAGNLFLGQFFFDDEQVDREFFRQQARRYGFDEDQYLAALDRAPRWSRETINNVMTLYSRFADMISTLSYSNVKLARSLAERQRAEEEKERLLSAIEQSGEIVVIADPRGAIQYVNPAFEAATGYSRKEVLGQNPRILKSGQQDEAFYKNLWETISAGKNWTGRFVNRRKDGSLYIEEANISPVIGESGRIVNYVAVKHDITEHLRLSEERATLEAQFQQAQKLESVGRLAGGVAHDLNNMLTPILGYSEMLVEDFGPDDIRKESAREIVSAGMKARDLVRQLLAFSRKQVLEFKPLDLNQVLIRFEKLLRRTMREDVDIQMNLAPSLPLVRGDVGQLEQVVMNLAVNAQDAMPGGGGLSIATSVAVLDEDYAGSHPGVTPGRYVMLSIQDTGSGMDAQTQAHLFEPFFTTKGKEKGTGLGLATVYGIVKQHGGNIWLYSEPGQGTVFKIHLPVSQETEAAHESPAGEPELLGGSETILLAEDNAQVRALAQMALRRQGYTVLSAESGQAALELLQSHGKPVDLLVTDVVMPEMSGKDLFGRLSGAPSLKVLYMSGYTDDVIAHQGVLEDNVHFIQKPFSPKALAAKVRKVLDQE